MRSLFLWAAFIFIPIIGNGEGSAYHYSIDLSKIENEKLEVTLETPSISEDTIEFHFPRIVPGTYEISDFGNYISEFSAFDKNGEELDIERLDVNRYQIKGSLKLNKISYKVLESYGAKDVSQPLFEPQVTNFVEGRVYLLNTFAIFGYLDGYKRRSFDIKVNREDRYYGATSLRRIQTTGSYDRFLSSDYYELADSPLMYTLPDTAEINLNGTKVLISVYSPNKIVSAKGMRTEISEILKAQESYLGGTLPVDRYSILVFMSDSTPPSRATGALEHSNSTVFSIMEAKTSEIASWVRRVTAHEFFHIITPLNIHSEQIHDFDYINPEMSEHLWFYEGLTEYAAHHVQVKEGLISFEKYLGTMQQKMRYAMRYYNDTLSLTEFSKNVLTPEMSRQYGNIYLKGSLVGLCLDIQIRNESQGAYGIQELMSDLGKRYGKEKPFKDEELIPLIGDLTSTEIEDYLNNCVVNGQALPIKESLNLIGVDYLEKIETSEFTLGNIVLDLDRDKDQVVVKNISKVNEFGKSLGYQEGDVLISLDETSITATNYRNAVNRWKSGLEEGQAVEISVLRKNSKGKEKTVKLKASAVKIPKVIYHNFVKQDNPEPEKLELRKSWGNVTN